MENTDEKTVSWLDKPVFKSIPSFRIETLLIVILLLLAFASRFYILGARVMSHDEVNHVVPAWDLFTGKGYRHDPVTHGPVQFHLLALSYFLLGDNDFSARVPAALYSVATVLFVALGFRRYLGRNGSLIAAFLFLISPYMLFYGRYTRNEAFVALYGVLTLFAVIRYLEKGGQWPLYLLTAATALHFATKETSFIYAAQLLLFLAFLFMDRIARAHWPDANKKNLFLILLAGAMILLMLGLSFGVWNSMIKPVAVEGEAPPPATGLTPLQIGELISVLIALAAGVVAAIILLRTLGWKTLKQERTFDLLILFGTLILPQLTAFPIKIIGTLIGTNWNPLDYSGPGIIRTAVFLIIMAGISAGVGMLWRPKIWWKNFVLFYAIFTVFYTTFFTNGFGFFTGIIGSLGYWLEQQGVQRGSQPLYFYALIQIPIYEYLAALGTLVAVYFGVKYRKFANFAGLSPAAQVKYEEDEPGPGNWASNPELNQLTGSEVGLDPENPRDTLEDHPESVVFDEHRPIPILALLVFWSVTALVAYSLAGEKMPWLTVHIALPMILAAGWGFGFLVDTTPWQKLKENKAWLALLLVPVFLASLGGVLGSILGDQPPFQGNTLEQLQSTSTFLFSIIALAGSSAGILKLLVHWSTRELIRLVAVVFFAYLSILTIRTASRASYVNYDNAKEFLVYAHAASGPKQILAQVEEISRRTTRGLDIAVAYDNASLYPYWWYFRDYPNKRWFTDNPTRDLREAPLIIAGSKNWQKLDAITRNNYQVFEYMRLWWPMQDYYNLTWDRIWNAISDPAMRSAVYKIWFDRDYSDYAQLTGSETLTLENWVPGEKLRFFVRKDIIGQIWNYGAVPAAPLPEQVDPYIQSMISVMPDQVVGQPGSEPGQFQAPRGMAIAPDGSIFVADSRNHRIQHFSAEGAFINTWGSFGDVSQGEAPGGTFYEPWGVAVSPDGRFVFVADTWNHRIQKFTTEGQFLTGWGYFGQAEAPEAFWGPRALAFDSSGRLYVTDTGNKRVVIFDQDGNYISQFGSSGFDPGQFDEQVGIAVSQQGEIFVADTWNSRIQVFTFDETSGQVLFSRSWEVTAWLGESLENKPWIAVDSASNVFITDPEGYRVLEFNSQGAFIRGWGDYSPGVDGFGLASGIVIDDQDRVWVSDGANNVLLRFSLPPLNQ